MTVAPRLVPIVNDRDTGGYFAAASRSELAVTKCQSCTHVLHPPRTRCERCGSLDVAYVVTSGRGVVHSWAVVHHQVHPGFPVPYTLVLVDLDDFEGVRFVGQIPGSHELSVGAPMEVWFEEVADGVVVPNWRPADRAESGGARE